MAKLSPLKPREVISKLKKIGYIVDHISGSHYIMLNPSSKSRIPVPYHAKDVKTGTLRSIINQTGLSVEEFMKIK
ncbi:MAG: type II toxin-antitoxin system HicA family toxin [Candidatus Woykebacteria bacterium]